MPRIEPIPWDRLSPGQQARFEAGFARGANNERVTFQTFAYADHAAPPDDGDRHPSFPDSLLGGKLLELVRIRSAQLGGCAPCSGARKVASATDEAVACLIDPIGRSALSERERLALELLERLSADHHGIDDAFYRRLAARFTTAEIIELGRMASMTMGYHRFLHTLDFFGDAPPVIPYDPDQVGVSWGQLHGGDTTEP
jgi:alkylhydroperoxidase family enzyme